MHFVAALAVPGGLLFVSILIHYLARYTSLPYLIDLLLEHDTANAFLPGYFGQAIPTFPNHSESLAIPRIIHQTYPNISIPDVWFPARNSCQSIHPSPSYEHILWTDELALSFLGSHYSWFLPTYLSYPYAIQRADSIRYFALRHFGGTYLDLDVGCARDLEPLNSFPAWVHRTSPSGVSNEAMGGAAGHAFWVYATEELTLYARNWGSPYVTVMYTTGPLFLSVIWRKWVRKGRDVGADKVMIMSEDMFNVGEERFFAPVGGSTWHSWDVKAVGWITEHVVMLLLALAGTIICYVALRCRLEAKVNLRWFRKDREYVVMDWVDKLDVV